MKKIDANIYVTLGEHLQHCRTFNHETTSPSFNFALTNLKYAISPVISDQSLKSRTIDTPAQTLISTVDRILKHHTTGNGYLANIKDPASQLGYEAPALQAAISDLSTALRQGLPTLNIYAASAQGTHDLNLLINSAGESTFGPLSKYISSSVTKDFDDAGRCLAFGLYTAAGYHSARACEGMLREYAKKFLTQEEVDSAKMMGQLIGALDKVSNARKPDAKVLDRAKRVKDYDRNELMHPGRALSQIDARSVFSIAGELIGMIAHDHVAIEADEYSGQSEAAPTPLD